MSPRHILAALAVTVALTGCNVVQPYEAEVDHAEGCRLVSPGRVAQGANRLIHYRTAVDMGDPLPTSVSTRGGSAVRTWVGRGERTARVDNGFSGLSLLLIPHIGGMIIGGFLLLILFAVLFQKSTPPGAAPIDPAERRRNAKRLAIITAATLGIAIASGYFAGSVISIDNTTASPLSITLDGQPIVLPPRSFVDQRIWGSNIDVDVRANGQVVESATLHLDDDVGDGILRTLFTNGRFVYNVCGLNSYSLQTAHYGRR